ncbi:hypothetical protein A5320_13990 [Rheinheimera sp. SA_1]|uniref:DUF3718 domain-containing protein n=1 Tax=Rheinheimera sp. SA_1 TaxID=1827365 RepID=UPI0008008B3C|nr:DUF3718 domain-containing protein [Rheinheimera sp. SA_1]OBP14822.1 hypothetical protein A5320_13990 [Rheinheimera sp. SA_1]
MKKFQLVSCAVLLAITATATAAHAVEYVAADDNPASKLCVSAAMDRPIKFMVEMRDNGVSKRYAANKITCNGTNITSFAQQAGNEGNYKMLNRHRRGHVEISDLAQLPAANGQIMTVSSQVNEAARP